MVLSYNAHFPHRLDNDGVYHSFCRACFRTVASSRREADLADGERKHECSGSPIFAKRIENDPLNQNPAKAKTSL
jgi:hypothetical protein